MLLLPPTLLLAPERDGILLAMKRSGSLPPLVTEDENTAEARLYSLRSLCDEEDEDGEVDDEVAAVALGEAEAGVVEEALAPERETDTDDAGAVLLLLARLVLVGARIAPPLP